MVNNYYFLLHCEARHPLVIFIRSLSNHEEVVLLPITFGLQMTCRLIRFVSKSYEDLFPIFIRKLRVLRHKCPDGTDRPYVIRSFGSRSL